MADVTYSILPALRRLTAEGVPYERQLGIVLDDVARVLGREAANDWLADRLWVADRVIDRVRRRMLADRISALESRVAELEARQ